MPKQKAPSSQTSVKATPALRKTFGLRADVLCYYYEIYDGDGNLFTSGCLDNGCASERGRCQKVAGAKKCRCLVEV